MVKIAVGSWLIADSIKTKTLEKGDLEKWEN